MNPYHSSQASSGYPYRPASWSETAESGKLKKQLTYLNRDTYRLESGDYRIIYTLQYPYISLLTLRRRKEDTYNEAFQSEFLGGFAPDIEVDVSPSHKQSVEHTQSSDETKLPEPITKELLVNLFIPAEYHARLLHVQSEEALISVRENEHTLCRICSHCIVEVSTPETSFIAE